MPNFKRKKKEDFEKDLEHKAVYNGKVDEKSLQDRRDAVQGPGSRTSTSSSREKVDGVGGLQFPGAPSMGEALGSRSILLIAGPFLASAMTA